MNSQALDSSARISVSGHVVTVADLNAFRSVGTFLSEQTEKLLQITRMSSNRYLCSVEVPDDILSMIFEEYCRAWEPDGCDNINPFLLMKM